MSDLRNNLPPIQERLIRSLMAVNDNDQLTEFIRDLQKVKISQESEIFLVISLCIDSYPAIINHPQRGSLEELYDLCFKNPQDMLDILEKPMNSKAKEVLYAYIKQLANKYKATLKQKNAPPLKNLLDSFVQYVASHYDPRSNNPSKIVRYLLEDYAHFIAQAEQNRPASSPRKSLK